MAKSTRRLGAVISASALALSLVACGAHSENTWEDAGADSLRLAGGLTSDDSAEAVDATTDDEIYDRDIPAGGMDINVFSLRVGDCIDSTALTNADEIDSVRIVLCSESHDAEVFYSHLIEGELGAPYPGDQAVLDEATNACQGTSFEQWVGVPYADSTLSVNTLFPIQSSWERLDDREVLCIAISQDPVTGEFQGSNL